MPYTKTTYSTEVTAAYLNKGETQIEAVTTAQEANGGSAKLAAANTFTAKQTGNVGADWIGGDVRFGRTPNTATPDFKWHYANEKLMVRSVMIGDVGDAPDLAIRRAGPDGVAEPHGDYNGALAALGANVNIGSIYWEAWDGTDWDGSSAGQGKQAHIYARTTEAQTQTARGTKLVFGTTANGSDQSVDRMEIEQDGIVKTPVGLRADGGVVTFRKTGAPVDTDFAAALRISGLLAVDETNNRLYVRVGANWRWVLLT